MLIISIIPLYPLKKKFSSTFNKESIINIAK